jgi:hypothetical protein
MSVSRKVLFWGAEIDWAAWGLRLDTYRIYNFLSKANPKEDILGFQAGQCQN